MGQSVSTTGVSQQASVVIAVSCTYLNGVQDPSLILVTNVLQNAEGQCQCPPIAPAVT